MLTVLPLKERNELERLYRSHKLEPDGNSAAVVARQGEEMLGYCLFHIASERIVVEILEPQSDLYLADGILRSALHVAVTRGIHNAFYAGTAPEKLLGSLNFIENDEEKRLNIGKLFSSCKNCEK